jgi:aminoglycoside/choline kinase family phosphotransferase
MFSTLEEALMEDVAEIAQRVRAAVRSTFGREPGSLERIGAGLGRRCFVRVRLPGHTPGTLIARVDAPEDLRGRPPGAAAEPPLEPLRTVLETASLPVPRHYGGNGRDVELLEDLGDRSLDRAASAADARECAALYEEAVALVERIQRVPAPSSGLPAFARRMDSELIGYKARLFAEWSLPEVFGRPCRRAEEKLVEEAFAWIARRLESAPMRLAHRDFQSRNLHLHAREGEAPRLFMIDFQGALRAPPEYDLVCLLRDSYRELPWEEVERLCRRVRPRLPDAPEPDVFAQRFDLLTLTRKGKDHARFLYAARARGETAYLAHLPATVRALKMAARRTAGLDPVLGRLAEPILALPETSCVR